MVDLLEHPRCVESDTGAVDHLSVRIVSDTEHLRMFRVIDGEIEVITRHDPIQIPGGELTQRDSSAGYHTLQLVVRTGLEGIGKRRYLGLDIRVRNEHGDDLPVVLIEELDGMRESAVLAVLMCPQVPKRAIEKSLGGLREEVVLLPGHLIDV